jgi:hypothetical protein
MLRLQSRSKALQSKGVPLETDTKEQTKAANDVLDKLSRVADYLGLKGFSNDSSLRGISADEYICRVQYAYGIVLQAMEAISPSSSTVYLHKKIAMLCGNTWAGLSREERRLPKLKKEPWLQGGLPGQGKRG